jgi:LPS O-antigen subunit length determinant protein (WzzB/FepE family)
MAIHEWDGNLMRLPRILLALEARIDALEERLRAPSNVQVQQTQQAAQAAQAAAMKQPAGQSADAKGPDPQKVAADAMKAFVDVTDKPAAPPAKGKA